MPPFRVGKPYSARRRTTPWTPGPGAFTVPWEVDTHDGEFDPATNLTSLVIGLDGLYLATFGAVRGTPGSSLFWFVDLKINGAVASRGAVPATTSAGVGQGGAWCGQLVGGDVVELAVTNPGTAAIAVAGTHLTVVRIGPVRWT